MKIPIYQVDAFTTKLFGGNPAAVCPLESWPETQLMQDIAMENNLSETAFYIKRGNEFEIKWFTPELEMDLAGHPTLATAHVIFNHTDFSQDEIIFHSNSGELRVKKDGDLMEMNFPARMPESVDEIALLSEGMGIRPLETWKSRDYLLVYPSEEVVLSLKPNLHLLAQQDCLGIIATAPGENSDFVSRFFAPRAGISEDPVTGSAHATLIPFWAERLQKEKLHAYQVSQRRGELFCRHQGERVTIAGRAVTFMQGEISL